MRVNNCIPLTIILLAAAEPTPLHFPKQVRPRQYAPPPGYTPYPIISSSSSGLSSIGTSVPQSTGVNLSTHMTLPTSVSGSTTAVAANSTSISVIVSSIVITSTEVLSVITSISNITSSRKSSFLSSTKFSTQIGTVTRSSSTRLRRSSSASSTSNDFSSPAPTFTETEKASSSPLPIETTTPFVPPSNVPSITPSSSKVFTSHPTDLSLSTFTDATTFSLKPDSSTISRISFTGTTFETSASSTTGSELERPSETNGYKPPPPPDAESDEDVRDNSMKTRKRASKRDLPENVERIW
ncbi:hypothetical protein GQ44DRAFT_773008 [Phaeosphaeriaceae sp. PMI808]|nr:hypothetical protein GQ44DRAFT_773008 [Phaeosphaeriaceae sp. PMI808]